MMEKIERISLKKVSKKFKIGFKKNRSFLARIISLFSGRESKKDIVCLKDISLNAYSGEMIGVIGSNGSGKSTLLRVISGIYKQDSGTVKTNGKIISLINLNIGMQDRLSMKDNIYLCGSLFGLGRKTIAERLPSIIKFAELEEYLETKLYQFSSGMIQRLAFSIAMHCNPEILLLDEVFEVGDESFRKKSQEKIKNILDSGATIIFVTHDLENVKYNCNRSILINDGEMIASGNSEEVITKYLKLIGVLK